MGGPAMDVADHLHLLWPTQAALSPRGSRHGGDLLRRAGEPRGLAHEGRLSLVALWVGMEILLLVRPWRHDSDFDPSD